MTEAPDVINRALQRIKPADRGVFLRALLAHAAASLVLHEGERGAGEAVYRLGDAIVGCGETSPNHPSREPPK